MITQVRVENFRGLETLEIDLSPFHALVGVNGSGKTAILEALDLLFSRAQIANRVTESDFHSGDKGPIKITATLDRYFVAVLPDGFTAQAIPCQKAELTIKRREAAASGRALSDPWVISRRCIPLVYEDRADLDPTLLPDGTKLEDLAAAVKEGGPGFEITRRASSSKMKIRSEIITTSKAKAGFPNVFYFGRQREKQGRMGFGTLLSRMGRDLNWRYRRACDLDEAVEKWENYYGTVLKALHPRGGTKLLQSLRDTAGDLTGHSFKDFEIGLLQLEQPFSRAFLGLRTGSNQIELQQMGSGVSLVVTLCLLEQIGLRSKEEVIFLIDEPELHLHPQLQRALSDHLKGSDPQIVCSTHSPAFLDLAKPASITRMARSFVAHPDKPILATALAGKTIAEHLEDIARYYLHRTIYQEQDAKLFFADKIVLVEGTVEEFGLSIAAAVKGLDLPNTTILNCRGKPNIPHYALLCRAYGIPFFILFDRDGLDLTAAENARVLESAGTAPTHAFATSLEDVLGVSTSKHKAAAALAKIEGMTSPDDLPSELAVALEEISKWANTSSGA